MKFNYDTKTLLETYTSSALYKIEVPKFIVEIIGRAKEEKCLNINEFLDTYLSDKSQLKAVTVQSFGSFKYLINSDINGPEVQGVLEYGYAVEEERIDFKINSYAPLINLYELFLNDSKITLYNKDDINEELTEIITDTIPGAFDVNVNEISLLSNEEEELSITIDVEDDGSMNYEGNEINVDQINKEAIFNINNLVRNVYQPINNLSGYKKLTHDAFENFKDWNPANENDFYIIKDNSIEFVRFASFMGYPVFHKENSILKNNFDSDKDIYSIILNEYLNRDIKLNSFIKNAFIKDSKEFQDKFLKSPNLENELKDGDVLRNLLLSKEKFFINVDIDVDKVTKLIKKATVENVGTIVSKLNDSTKDKILDYKVIRKISENNNEQLTKVQLEILENEEKRMKAMEDEYVSIIGEITVLGLREKIRELSKSDKKTYKIDKKVKEWLDTNIGHNKGIESEVTIETLDKARNILSKAQKVSKFLKSDNEK